MKYYLGTGEEFKKEECKEYKTESGVLTAMSKTEDGVVWSENGELFATVKDGKVMRVGEKRDEENTSDKGAETAENGKKDDETGESTIKEEKAENGANTKPKEGQQDDEEKEESDEDGQQEETTIIPKRMTRATVVCDGTLNLRRSASWESENICGRASKGQSYYVKAIHTVAGKRMVESIDGLYMSGEREHVSIEEV